jgi:hypothetical protein
METLLELTALHDVRQRLLLPGPHATVRMRVTAPGAAGDDRLLRWHAARGDLHRLGADEGLIARIERALDSIAHRGLDAVITTDATTTAYCWLTDRRGTPGETTKADVGPFPALAPAIVELTGQVPIVGAVVDRIGADIFVFDRLDRVLLASVEGDDEFVHRGAPGGWAQARYQRRAELTWSRNADLDAEQLIAETDRVGAALVVLTGDDRATALVAERVAATGRHTVVVVEAGGRNEPESPARLHRAAIGVLDRRRADETERRLALLAERIETHDRAIAGDSVRLAVEERLVDTLFVAEPGEVAGIDGLLRDAVEGGAAIVIVDRLRAAEHHPPTQRLAALLRVDDRSLFGDPRPAVVTSGRD